ncbi:MAG: D-glucuronyl C5-epimerase family protein, partial [Gallionellaceae bacterium]
MRKMKLRTTAIIMGLSGLLAILSSSYTERLQTNIFASVKNYFEIGQMDVYKEVDGVRLKFHFGKAQMNPVAIAQQALDHSENELIARSGLTITPYPWRSAGGESVLPIADFLLTHYQGEQLSGIDVLRLPYEFDYPFYGLTSPWYSGMAQGHGIIVMLHAYLLTGNEDYLNAAIRLYRVLELPIAQGGVLINVEDAAIVFEEYADPGRASERQPRVLNGNLFAIDGVFWLWQVTGSESVEQVLRQSIASVNYLIDRYDAAAWSYYDSMQNFANAKYHHLHINQLQRIQEYANALGMGELENVERIRSRWQL